MAGEKLGRYWRYLVEYDSDEDISKFYGKEEPETFCDEQVSLTHTKEARDILYNTNARDFVHCPVRDKILNTLFDLFGYTQYTDDDNVRGIKENGYMVRAYSSTDNRIHLTWFYKTKNSDDANFIVYEIPDDNVFIIVGCACSHPLVLTNKFVYFNSDGSGPLIKCYSNPEELMKRLLKWFDRFTEDECH